MYLRAQSKYYISALCTCNKTSAIPVQGHLVWQIFMRVFMVFRASSRTAIKCNVLCLLTEINIIFINTSILHIEKQKP